MRLSIEEYAMRFTEEERVRMEEYDRKKNRRMLWLGKFAFPKVDTRKTKLLFVPPDYHRYYLPIIEPLDFRMRTLDEIDVPKHESIDLKDWGYNGKRWQAVLRFGYYEKDDILIVCPDTFKYQPTMKPNYYTF